MADIKQSEVARLAGVSQATVSRVLNHDPQVNDEMRQRVLAVVESLGYVPDARAQSLRAQRTRLLGLVIHRAPQALTYDPFFSALMASIIEQAGRHGYHLCVDTARTPRSQRAVYEELLRTRRVDGLILVESETRDQRIVHLTQQGFPFVLLGRYDPPDAVYSVDNDNIGAGQMVTEYLIKQGHRRIAYIGGASVLTVTRDRLQGYRNALEQHGLPYNPQWVRFTESSLQGGQRACNEILSMSPRPTAVVAMDDLIAVGAMRTAQKHGIRIPQEMAFLGFNDTPLCEMVEPTLTSVAIDIPSLARIATERLISLIEGCPVEPKRVIVSARLIVRGSSG